MFHLALYDASIANGAVLLQVAAVQEQVIAPSGSGFLVPGIISKIMRIASVGVNLTRTQLKSASIDSYAPFDMGGVNVGAAIESPARLMDFKDNPIPLQTNEELDAFGVQSNAAAQRISVAVWFCDAPVRPVMGRMFSVHWTASATLTANGWTAITPTLDNGIPSGTFSLVGSRVISAGALFHRIIPRGGTPYRPGGFAYQAQDGFSMAGERYGGLGEWMKFTNTTLPQVEVFSRSADTSEEGYFDLIQIG